MADMGYSDDQSQDGEQSAPASEDAPEEQSDPKETEGSSESDEEILETARKRAQLAADAESEIRRNSLDDLKFRAGDQWPIEVKQDRARDGRPCLTINRIPQFIQQITNDQRQNRPSIKVHAVDDGADVDTAKIIQGLIRHIEYNSNAEVAYDTAFEGAATHGFGFWRVLSDFSSPDSFDQELLIKRIRNPFSVFMDPYAQEPDGSDAMWGFIDEFLPEDDYKELYPKSKLCSMDDWTSIGNTAPNWIRGKEARIAEYYYKEFVDTKIHLLSTGESVKDSELQAKLELGQQAGIQVSVVKTRIAKVPVVKWCKINAVEILEKTDWPGSFIPIIPVYGADLYIDGKRILEGVIRHAKDPQRMYNYWKSAETEAIALAPRAPFIGAEGQFEGHEQQWESSNRRNHPYLQYRPVTIGGQPAAPPARQAFEPAVQAITQASMQAADEIKATTGIYDASLGAQSQDSSGIAIQRRNTQAQTSNYHFIDNLTRSLRHTGIILIELIPKIYDTARSMRIVGDDGTHKVVKINQKSKNERGEEVLYQMDAGRYDVTVDVGPSYASKRQEAATSMQSLAQSYPQLMGIAGDLFVKNMDWPGAQEIADRIKKTLPPGVAEDGPQQPQVPPEVQQQMQQMNEMVGMLSKQLDEASRIIETKRIEIESKERIEMAKIQSDIEMTAAKLGSTEAMALLKHEVAAITARLGRLNWDQPIPDATQQFIPQQGQPGADQGAGQPPAGQPPTGGASPGAPMEPQGPMQ